jgi:L-iditol 2-dehydrogenase
MSSDIPDTMLASVLRGVGVLDVEERPVPRPQPGEVLVQVASVGVCGSDVHYYQHGRIAHFVVESPLVLGHEASGRIVAVGDGVPASRVGERVAIEPQKPCRTCEHCRSGAYNLCPRMEFFATPPIDGAFCEYVVIEADFAHPVPDEVSDDAAALLEPLSVGIAAARKGGVSYGDTVLIAGGGPIGVIAAQVCRAYGAAEVVVTDPDAGRRAFAEKYGATQALAPDDPELDAVRPHVFIDACGVASAIVDGVHRTRSGGSVVLVGSADEFPLSVGDVAMRELNVTGIFRYTNTWPTGIRMVATGEVALDPLVTDEYGLDEVEEALVGPTAASSLKRVVRPQHRRLNG